MPDKFIIQSHRGAGDLAPENTLDAFELGWRLGTHPEAMLSIEFHRGHHRQNP
jgi:hypothetical protein